MKTKGTMTKCLEKYMAFTRKSTQCAMIDKNGRNFLAKMHGFRRNSGRIGEHGGGGTGAPHVRGNVARAWPRWP